MASAATATATMAAAGFNDSGVPTSLASKRASTATTASSSLQTPGSGTFPSELRSPMIASPGFLKREAELKTPITPPSAYLDFLKQMSPAIASPAPTSTSARFSFNEKTCDRLSEISADRPPTSQPPLSRNTSFESNESTSTTASERSSVSTSSAATSTANRTRPESPRILIPPSPFAKPSHPRSARTPRRLSIPQSPFSPSQNAASPFQTTPLSAAPWSASYTSPVDPEMKPGKMSVRQVVTRTVTYCRTPLEPAPRGKRRKIEVQGPHMDDKVIIKADTDVPEVPTLPAPTSVPNPAPVEPATAIEAVPAAVEGAAA